MYFRANKNMLKFWVKDIENCKEKQDYIYFSRLEKIAEYHRQKASKQFIKKNLTVGGIYQNEYNNKKYVWNGKNMLLLKKDGSISQNYSQMVGITSFSQWKKIEK